MLHELNVNNEKDEDSVEDKGYGSMDSFCSAEDAMSSSCSLRCQHRPSPIAIVCIVSTASLIIEVTRSAVITVTSEILHDVENDTAEDHRIAFKIATTQSAYNFGLIFGNVLCARVAYSRGHLYPFWFGLLTGLGATSISAFASAWWVLALANLLVGLSIAFVANAGSTMVAIAFDDEDDRAKALAAIYSCRYGGTLFGYAGCLYVVKWTGRVAPFWALFAALVVTIAIRGFTNIENNRDENSINKPFQLSVVKSMLTDAQTLVLFGFNAMDAVSNSIYYSLVPLWIIEHISAKHWQLATIRLSSATLFVFSTNVFGFFVSKTRSYRWIYTFISFMLVAVSFIIYSFIRNIWQAFGPACVCTLAFSWFGAFIHSWLSDVAEKKFDENYATMFAIDVVFCRTVSIVLTLCTGFVQPYVGYPAIFIGLGIVDFIYSFSSYSLRGI
ncbi:synaptic vesicular amine transporter-like [Tubulanus polymorphus]|uniref:synaptic vesicular amine transporter-like n=1 Tax=Tubulanus polymorphus TaxID=672921 RepID=UPI003DA32FBD